MRGIVAKSWREDQQRAIQNGVMDDLFDSLISAAKSRPRRAGAAHYKADCCARWRRPTRRNFTG
jgi:hypothetical protein